MGAVRIFYPDGEIEREMRWRTVKYCTNDGLDNLREALNEIQKIKKGLE